MKRLAKLLSLFLISILVVGIIPTGCTAQKSAATKEEVKLTFTYWGSPFEKQAIEGACKAFEAKNPGIKVNPMQIPSDYDTKITTMMAGNEAPDIGYMDSLAYQWASQGKFVNILDKLAKDPDVHKSDFLDSSFYNWAPGKCIGIMPAIEPFALFYNKDMLASAGVETPPVTADTAWNWDKFVEVCKKLTIDTKGRNATDPAFDAKNIKQYGVQFDTGWTAWINAVNSNGGYYVTQDGKYVLNQPEATEGIQMMADLINKYHVAPSPVAAKSIPAPAVALQSKKVAMTINGQWISLDLGQAKLNFGVGVLPMTKKSTTVIQGGVITIFSASKHPEEAWKLWKFLYNPDNAIQLYSSGLWMPAMKKWYTDSDLLAKWAEGNPAHPEGYIDAVVNQVMNNGIIGPGYLNHFSNVDALVEPALDQVWLGKKSAQDALNGVDAKVQAEMAK